MKNPIKPQGMSPPSKSINNGVVFSGKMYDNINMDIQSASVNLSQARVQEDAAILVQSKILDAAKEQAAALEKLLASAQFIVDPNMGQNVNIIA